MVVVIVLVEYSGDRGSNSSSRVVVAVVVVD